MPERPPPTKVRCTYPTCKLFFKSEEEMKKHKSSSEEHEYCTRCDEDCEDEERLLIHKIRSERHIICPICGIEFNSEGGRDAHIRQNHRAAQSLPCHGCKVKFKSASGLMNHIERNKCPRISRIRLIQEQSKKFMIKEALNDGMGLSLPIIPNQAEQNDPDHEDIDGGVKFNISEAQKREINNREAIANQPNPGQGDPTASVSAMLALKHWPSLGDKAQTGKSVAPSDLMGFSEMSISEIDGKENVIWKGKGAVRSVIESTVPPRPFGVGVPDAGETLRILDNSWDPTRFFNSLTGECECSLESKQCPRCLRLFKTTTALIAHFESASTRCDISDASRYGQIVDELTGGIIQATGYNEDGTVKYESGKLELAQTTTVGKDLRQPIGPQKW
ncbi:hypothetical protein BBP40_000142 [Aspergillus hancockii]|nr:hypothetical protein BBP40_000142 [Aspergillus hancockii]